MKTPAAVVYLVTNQVNGKNYVGVTRRLLAERWNGHVYTATTRGSRTRLHSAIRKYGAEHFTVEPLASCLSVAAAKEAEQELIRRLAPDYNQTNGGEITEGRRVPREVVERIRVGNTGKKRTPAMRARMGASKKAYIEAHPKYYAVLATVLARGRANTDQEKRKAAAGKSARERIWTDESRAKLSASCKGRRYGQDVLDRVAAKHRKEVECIELKTVFDSVSEAAEGTGLSVSGVSRVCKGQRNGANGLTFQFINNATDNREVCHR